jgi:tripartite-type tricarboxylate transporter receptor subunit TctC
MLREAFEKASRDPELVDEAGRMKLEISPLTGEQVQALITDLYATPPELVEKVRNIMVVK